MARRSRTLVYLAILSLFLFVVIWYRSSNDTKAITKGDTFSSSPLEEASSSPSSNQVNPTDRLVHNYIHNNRVMIFSKSYCQYSRKVKQLFQTLNVPYEAIELDLVENGDKIQAALLERTGQSTVPNAFVRGLHVGGNGACHEAYQSGRLQQLLK